MRAESKAGAEIRRGHDQERKSSGHPLDPEDDAGFCIKTDVSQINQSRLAAISAVFFGAKRRAVPPHIVKAYKRPEVLGRFPPARRDSLVRGVNAHHGRSLIFPPMLHMSLDMNIFCCTKPRAKPMNHFLPTTARSGINPPRLRQISANDNSLYPKSFREMKQNAGQTISRSECMCVRERQKERMWLRCG